MHLYNGKQPPRSILVMSYHHLTAKSWLDFGIFTKFDARNLPTCGYRSILEGPIYMLQIFIILSYTYTMPYKHYGSKPTSLRCHLMAKHCLKMAEFLFFAQSEARNLPTCGCKSVVEGPANTVGGGVLLTLLYTYIGNANQAMY